MTGHRRPSAPDALLALAAFAALVADGLHQVGGRSGAVIAASALTCAPLLVRRRWPLAVLAATTAGTCLCLAVFQPDDSAIGPTTLALFTVAATGDRRRSLRTGLVMAPALLLLIAVTTPGGVWSVESANVAWVALALIAGDGLRTRRAYRAALVERAAQREARREADVRRRIEEERLRIARDVHDGVAHSLAAISVQAGVAAYLAHDTAAAQQALLEIKAASGEALRDLRRTLGAVRAAGPGGPPEAHGLADAEQLAAPVRAAGIRVAILGCPPPVPLPPHIDAVAYRIVQEALTNVLRHARAASARVSVSVDRDVLVLLVDDDGRPRAGPATLAGGGHGIRGMTERARAVGGRLAAGAGPGGWRVSASLPLNGGPA